MNRGRSRPTDAELGILNVLWEHGEATVREVHERLGDDGRAYTTTLKLLQLMTEKGLVERDESRRSHVYRAAIDRTSTQTALLRELRSKAFGGSTASLILGALSDTPASREEIDAVRRLLDQMEQRDDEAEHGGNS